MSAFDPPYLRRKNSAGGGSLPPPPPPPPAPASVYAEPVMTTEGDYMIMLDGDIAMAEVSVTDVYHNVDVTVPAPSPDDYTRSETAPVDDPEGRPVLEGHRWYVPSTGVLYTLIFDGTDLVWVEL